MNPIRCLVIDDEELARTLLVTYAKRIPHLEIVACCKDSLAALSLLQEQTIDLLFLDIQMPELTGIELLQTLPHKPVVIFTTAYPDYALEGFRLDAVDYLLKPFPFERFVQAVNKASELLQLRRNVKVAAPQPALEKEPERDYIMVKSEHKIFRIKHDQIFFIQSMREYVAFQTENGRILSLNSLKKLEQELPSSQFVRTHKSFMVAIDKIESLEGNRLLIKEEKIPIGASFKEEILKLLL